MNLKKKIIGIFVCMLLVATTCISFAEETGDDNWWPMFQHDSRHTGFSNSIAPNTARVRWNTGTEFGIIRNSPAVVDDKVYFGVEKTGYNGVYCFDAADGSQLWKNDSFGGDVFSICSPAVYNDNVYIGSSQGNMYCLDTADGNLIWQYSTGAQIKSPTVVVAQRN